MSELDVARIRELWYQHGRARKVAALAGVSTDTVRRYRPADLPTLPAYRGPVAAGYARWGAAARQRWDEFWSRVTADHLHRLAALFEMSNGQKIQRERDGNV